MAEHLRSAGATDVTRENWRESPYNRRAFRNVAGVLAVDPIPNAPESIWAMPSALKPLDGFRLNTGRGAPLNLETWFTSTASDALVILHNGELVHEYYAEGMTAETPHILMSASKAVTGLLAGILDGRDNFSVTASVTDYVPEMAATGFAGATIRDLLDMRAGVVMDKQIPGGYDATVSGMPGTLGFHALLQSMNAPHTGHGGNFSYVSANTDLVAWAMQRATGRSFATLLSDELWRPCGMEEVASVVIDNEGAAWASGGISATARDLARLGALVLAGGRRNDTQIVPTDWINDLYDGGDASAWRYGEWGKSFAFVGAPISYRAGWYSVHREPRELFAMGVHGQNLFVDQKSGVVIAKFSSMSQRIDPVGIGLTHLAVPELIRCATQEVG